MQQKNIAIHALTLIIGLLLVIIGIIIPSTLYSAIAIAIGGAIIGAVIGNLFTVINFDPNNFMENSHRLPFATHSDKLDDFRNKYYCYYLSKSAREYKWRLGILNYESYHSALYLTGYLKVKNDDGISYVYSNIGMIMDNRLVAISKAVKGNQNVSVLVFPKFTTEFATLSTGVGLYENWHSKDMLAPIILMKRPVAGHEKIGRIDDEAINAKLWDISKDMPESNLSKEAVLAISQVQSQ